MEVPKLISKIEEGVRYSKINEGHKMDIFHCINFRKAYLTHNTFRMIAGLANQENKHFEEAIETIAEMLAEELIAPMTYEEALDMEESPDLMDLHNEQMNDLMDYFVWYIAGKIKSYAESQLK